VPTAIFLHWTFKKVLRTIKNLLRPLTSGGYRSLVHCRSRVRSPSNGPAQEAKKEEKLKNGAPFLFNPHKL
jgi:hypothetical protein